MQTTKATTRADQPAVAQLMFRKGVFLYFVAWMIVAPNSPMSLAPTEKFTVKLFDSYN